MSFTMLIQRSINSAEAPGVTNTPPQLSFPLKANGGGVFIPWAADWVNLKGADLYSALEKPPGPSLLIFTPPCGSQRARLDEWHRVSEATFFSSPLIRGSAINTAP